MSKCHSKNESDSPQTHLLLGLGHAFRNKPYRFAVFQNESAGFSSMSTVAISKQVCEPAAPSQATAMQGSKGSMGADAPITEVKKQQTQEMNNSFFSSRRFPFQQTFWCISHRSIILPRKCGRNMTQRSEKSALWSPPSTAFQKWQCQKQNTTKVRWGEQIDI